MDKKLEVLEELSAESAQGTDVDILMIFHLLPDAKFLVKALTSNYNIQQIIGIPYSTEQDVVEDLENNYNVNISCPENIADVRNQAEEFIRTYPNEGRDLIILDIGGYCSEFLDNVDKNKIRGIVEDTNQGHWKYEDSTLDLPIYSIAQGEIKNLENKVVGEAITFSTERIMRNGFEEELTGKRVLVMGYGGIGKAVSKACDGRGAKVMVYDIDSVKMLEAQFDGFIARDKSEMLEKADLIIGCSGERSIGSEEIEAIDGECILASGSSKKVEFENEYIENNEKVDEGESWDEYNIAGSSIFLLNEGKPINFLDNSISLSVLDLIFSELFACVAALAKDKSHKNQVQEVPYETKQEIADRRLKNIRGVYQ